MPRLSNASIAMLRPPRPSRCPIAVSTTAQTDGKEPTVQVLVLPLFEKKVCAKNAAVQLFLQKAAAGQSKADRGLCEVCEKE